jgi:hypothetical protein
MYSDFNMAVNHPNGTPLNQRLEEDRETLRFLTNRVQPLAAIKIKPGFFFKLFPDKLNVIIGAQY